MFNDERRCVHRITVTDQFQINYVKPKRRTCIKDYECCTEFEGPYPTCTREIGCIIVDLAVLGFRFGIAHCATRSGASVVKQVSVYPAFKKDEVQQESE